MAAEILFCNGLLGFGQPSAKGLSQCASGGGAVAEEQRRLDEFQLAQAQPAVVIAQEVHPTVEQWSMSIGFDRRHAAPGQGKRVVAERNQFIGGAEVILYTVVARSDYQRSRDESNTGPIAPNLKPHGPG